MAKQTHQIEQQLINLNWVKAAQPHRIKDHLEKFARQQLLPQMESVFDELTRDGRLIQFDKVVINLGDIHSANWQKTFCDRLVVHLKEQLLQHHAGTPAPGANFEDTEHGAEIIFKQFLFYLHHGRLPWWGATRETAVLRKGVNQFSPLQWLHLNRSIANNDQARRRLLVFCEDEQLEQYFRTVFGLEHVARVRLLFVAIPADNSLHQSWRFYFWSRMIELGTKQRQPAVVTKCLQELLALRTVITTWIQDSSQTERLLVPNEQARQAMSTLPEPWRAWIAPFLKIDHRLEMQEHNASRLLHRLMIGENFDSLIRIITQAPQHTDLPPESSTMAESGTTLEEETSDVNTLAKHQEKAPESPITAAAAGMIIVHPFIEELFREQSLLTEHDFRSEECRHTGVHMLAYLAFGDLETQEYDVLLAKLLCAMPWEHPLLPWVLADEQRKACDQLLLAVLQHWSALKSRSVQFLRQQFFWRDGKLKTTDSGWRLTIEKRAQDILLDKLPWGIGVIRMPWMTKMLYVNWDS